MKAPGSLTLDTSIIIRHMRTADPTLASRLKQASELYVPLVALGEILYGIRRSGSDQRALEQWRRFSAHVVVLLPDEATASSYAELKIHLSAKGRLIPENDVWIAAAAHSSNLPLYCRDVHFDELADVMTIIQA